EIGLSQDDKNQLVSLYDGAIKYFDYNFKKIIDNLEKLGILDNTIIILTSDHGEEFWEHGGFAHGHTLYNELLHIPLIIRYPSHLPAKHIKPHVQLLDLFPTILSMAGIKNDFELRGNDLIPPILNNRDFNEEIFFEGLLFGASKKGILKENWKLIENTGERNDDTFETLGELMKYLYPEYKKSLELYNLDQDIQEKNNLINKYPDITRKLKACLRLFRIELSPYQQTKKVNLKKKLEDLKTLGYVK
ncbi:MAG: sulfatase-like hydrolase/transferase, partial [Candidatus Aminicenantaceae bacterium]